MAADFLTVWFGSLQPSTAETIDMSACVTPLIRRWGDVTHPDLGCRYRNRLYTHYVQFSDPRSWSLVQICDTLSLSLQAVRRVFHASESRLYTMKALGNRSAFRFCHLHKWLCRWNACWASVTTSQTWNNNTPNIRETPNQRKTDKKKERKIAWHVFFFCLLVFLLAGISSQWKRTHDDPCSASLGYFVTKNDCRHLKHYNTRKTKQNKTKTTENKPG